MNRQELERSWAITRGHLDAALSLLPPLQSLSELKSYNDFLDHNELELAWDELEIRGEAKDVPQGFWAALAAAAENMGLLERALHCKQRATGH